MLAIAAAGFGVLAPVAAHAVPIFAIDTKAAQHLISFDSSNPSNLTSSFAVSGLAANERLLGIDFRVNAAAPADSGTLYAVGSFGRIYTLNPATGAATFVTALGDSTAGSPVTLTGTNFGVDFNPISGLLRIVTVSNQNLRVVVAAPTNNTTTDSNLRGGPGLPPIVANIAYDRSDTNPSTPTTLYGIDSNNNTLVTIGSVNGSPASPNTGTVITVGPLGSIDPVAAGGFDIASGTGIAYAALLRASTTNTPPEVSSLYTIDLATGQATFLGAIGLPEDAVVIGGLAVVPEPAGLALLGFGALLAARRRRAR
jgi:hypothetical protein